MINYKRAYSGYKRTNFDKKSDKEKQKILIKHFKKLDIEIPKYVSRETLRPFEIKRAMKRIENEYKKRIKIEEEYHHIQQIYNRRIDYYKDKVLSGRGIYERDYLEGEEIFIQAIHPEARPFHADLFIFSHIKDERFSDIKAMRDRARFLEKEVKNIKGNMNEKNFYNVLHNKKMLKDAVSRMHELGASDFNIKLFRTQTNSLSNFELEIATKSVMEKIIDRYLGESAPELTVEREHYFIMHILGIVKNTKEFMRMYNV